MKKLISRIILFTIGSCVFTLSTVVYVGIFSLLQYLPDFETFRKPSPRVDVNTSNPFIWEREHQFHLSRVIPQYDEVICAIEKYAEDQDRYPEYLDELAPAYLQNAPRIYIRSGEYLVYEPNPPSHDGPPFTFAILGHYPGLAFMHGWELAFCPAEYPACAPGGDRHIRAHRVNDRWIWIHSSAL